MEFFGVSQTEWVGYLAMATVLISFLMKSMLRLRIVNSIGCLLFVFYGVLLNPVSIPIVLTNSVIFCINLYYLVIKKI
nr:uroporphyrinogen decarboxylase [uncultured Algibacter sp.]